MRTSPINRVIDHLRRAVLLPDGARLGDSELLSSFIERHDETALAALVGRHGPMVWGVCRRLMSHHDAEDAFQATFLVLVRKAASIRSKEMVGNWLYGVAHQTALLARRTAARRRAREVQVTEMPDIDAVQPDQWPDLRPLEPVQEGFTAVSVERGEPTGMSPQPRQLEIDYTFCLTTSPELLRQDPRYSSVGQTLK
jgi:RNA polymerase sigma factor (sigma-70 family)